MAAITVEGSTITFNQQRCIGCGNCIAACANDAITMQKKDWESRPPATMEDCYDQILKEKNHVREKEQKKKERLAQKKTSE